MVHKFFIKLSIKKKKKKHSDFTFDKLVAYYKFFFFDIFSILYLYNWNENNLT